MSSKVNSMIFLVENDTLTEDSIKQALTEKSKSHLCVFGFSIGKHIASFFFQLTLIVGWYGMNLKMPEFGWRYGYLFVIGISVLTVVGTLLFFKKKKWL